MVNHKANCGLSNSNITAKLVIHQITKLTENFEFNNGLQLILVNVWWSVVLFAYPLSQFFAKLCNLYLQLFRGGARSQKLYRIGNLRIQESMQRAAIEPGIFRLSDRCYASEPLWTRASDADYISEYPWLCERLIEIRVNENQPWNPLDPIQLCCSLPLGSDWRS